MKEHYDVVVVGSGFAGTILSRCLASQGRKVGLLEKGRHPRFAIGESSTPLAAIALERLAVRYGLGDLDALAAHGRWVSTYPQLQRGLKRGFSFYRHRPGEPLEPAPANRLLVAASPDDSVADCHWLRADVDAFLVERAVEEGVDYREECAVTGVEEGAQGLKLDVLEDGVRSEIDAAFVVDASGPEGVVARELGARKLDPPARFCSSVVFSHFSEMRTLDDVWRRSGSKVQAGPYPDERAAVHHLLDEGWFYVLPFDDGRVSAGLVADGVVEPARAESLWARMLDRYPTIRRQFEDAKRLRPLEVRSPLQYRLTKAGGRGWAALPHVYAFFDPMFSTGIAWSLLGVERLAGMLGGNEPGSESLSRYQRQLAAEADQVERLLYGAQLARSSFDSYAAHAQLYFALVSYEEVRQRLFGEPGGSNEDLSFLGGGDAWAEKLLQQSIARLEELVGEADGSQARQAYSRWIREAIAPRNVAGLADARRHNLYPVDLDVLVERSRLLGLEPEEMRAHLPRLRGLQDEPVPG